MTPQYVDDIIAILCGESRPLSMPNAGIHVAIACSAPVMQQRTRAIMPMKLAR